MRMRMPSQYMNVAAGSDRMTGNGVLPMCITVSPAMKNNTIKKTLGWILPKTQLT